MRAAPLRIVDQELGPVGGAARVLDGEAEGEQFADDPDAGHLTGPAPPLTGGRARWWRQQAALLVEPQGPWRGAGHCRRVSDPHTALPRSVAPCSPADAAAIASPGRQFHDDGSEIPPLEQFLHRTRGPFDVRQTGREPNSGRCGARRR
nr:hypothetical protein [Streptomyces sp. NWU49]